MLRVLKLLHVSDLASELGIAKMHHRQKFVVHPSLSLIGLDNCEFTVQLGIHLFISPAAPNFVNCLSHHGVS